MSHDSAASTVMACKQWAVQKTVSSNRTTSQCLCQHRLHADLCTAHCQQLPCLLADRAALWVCLPPGSAIFHRLSKHFDVVIVDEAAQAVEPSVMVPLVMGCKQVGALPPGTFKRHFQLPGTASVSPGSDPAACSAVQLLHCMTQRNSSPGTVLTLALCAD